jgi:hypothetical protein
MPKAQRAGGTGAFALPADRAYAEVELGERLLAEGVAAADDWEANFGAAHSRTVAARKAAADRTGAQARLREP